MLALFILFDIYQKYEDSSEVYFEKVVDKLPLLIATWWSGLQADIDLTGF